MKPTSASKRESADLRDAGVRDVGIAMVNYNAGDDIVESVRSLRKVGIEDIVVTDNGSSDGSETRLVESDPEVRLRRLPDKGFGTGTNRSAKDLDNDFIFVLNPDTRVHAGAIETLLAVLETDPTVGLVGPRLLNVDGSLYPSARKFPDFIDGVGHAVLGLFFPNNRFTRRYRRLDADYDTRHEVDWVSGAAMLLPRKAWEELGGFDEGFYLYMEDVDLCYRLHQAGWKVVYEPAAEITHIGGTGTATMPYRSLKTHHKSVIRYSWKHTRGAKRLLLPLFSAGLLLRLAVALGQKYLQVARARKS